jgi:isoquinoline 1-oxidoreductase
MGGGIAVTFSLYEDLVGATISPLLTDNLVKDSEDLISAWLHVNEQGIVTIYTGKAEVGQNIRTSLAQIVAEELDVPMTHITMILGDTALTPYDRGTFGSRSTPYMGPQLRQAAASAREYLLDLAAELWKVKKSSLKLEAGLVTNGSRKIDIGKLASGKKIIRPVDTSAPVKPVSEWKIAGKPILKVNGDTFVTGQHKYVSDMKLPEMLYGKVVRPPQYGATIKAVDLSHAKAIPGVVAVHDGDFIGVAAPTPRVAANAHAAVLVSWDTSPQPSHGEIFEHLRNKDGGAGRGGESSGNAASAYSASDIKINNSFTIDYIAHAPLEPRAGVAQWEGENLTVWVGTQRPFGVQEDLGNRFKIAKERVRVIMPDTGSGYGGKHTGEAGVEAAILSKAAGKPVKVVWTREEEFTWAYFRPGGVIEVSAGANKDGIVTSWEFHNYNSGGSGISTPYDVANKTIQYHPSESPLRQGSYRGLAATANTFARECIMNDLAKAAKIDPLDFRLKNLKERRMIDVLQAAAGKFNWQGTKVLPNHGIGIACGEEKGGFVATCAEVLIDPDAHDVKVTRVVVSFECGAIINPSNLENQVVGSVIQGLGGALFEWIDFKDGKIINPRFSQYRVPRFADIPKIESVLLNRTDLAPAGAGETPILAIAPAIRNAIDHATGKKLYALPMVPDGLPA